MAECCLPGQLSSPDRSADRAAAAGAAAQLRRALFSAAEDLKPDRQGRTPIRQRLREFARIENEVVIAGMNTYIELWDPAQWKQQMLTPAQLDEDLFAALGV